MAGASSEKTIYTYDKRAKDKVRKSGDSAKGKAVQLGEVARVFSTVVYFNPTHGRLDGAIHVPKAKAFRT
ncbi:patatin-like serine hydrolase [Colletotrichum tofieldiae]|nr:patatin-like serine hydrolase [Colletotrichum tofieldiae]